MYGMCQTAYPTSQKIAWMTEMENWNGPKHTNGALAGHLTKTGLILQCNHSSVSSRHFCILTQAILRRNQNSFCRFICICITPVSAVFMSVTAVSNFGNRSTMRRLHTRIVLWERQTARDEDNTGAQSSRILHERELLKLPQVCVQVFHHPVLVLNHLEYDL